MKLYRIYHVTPEGRKRYFVYLRLSNEEIRYDFCDSCGLAFPLSSRDRAEGIVFMLYALCPQLQPFHIEEIC